MIKKDIEIVLEYGSEDLKSILSDYLKEKFIENLQQDE